MLFATIKILKFYYTSLSVNVLFMQKFTMSIHSRRLSTLNTRQALLGQALFGTLISNNYCHNNIKIKEKKRKTLDINLNFQMAHKPQQI